MCQNLWPILMQHITIVWMLQRMKLNSSLIKVIGHQCRYKFLHNYLEAFYRRRKYLYRLEATLRWLDSCNKKGRNRTSIMTTIAILGEMPATPHTQIKDVHLQCRGKYPSEYLNSSTSGTKGAREKQLQCASYTV